MCVHVPPTTPPLNRKPRRKIAMQNSQSEKASSSPQEVKVQVHDKKDRVSSDNVNTDKLEQKKIVETQPPDVNAPARTARYWVKQLQLEAHPFMEGGYFKETFKDKTQVEVRGNDRGSGENASIDGFAR